MLEVTSRKEKDTTAAQDDARRARNRLTEINNEILRLRNEVRLLVFTSGEI